MTKFERDIGAALNAVDPQWNVKDTEHGLSMLRARLRRRTAARWTGVAVTTLVAGVGLAWASMGHRPEAGAEKQLSAPLAGAIRFSDGSIVTRLASDTLVSVVEAGPERIIAAVDRGQIHVEVTPRPARVFRILAGQVMVEALGTAFTVERDDERVRVAVRHGRVRVSWATGRTELEAGETNWFPPPEESRPAERSPSAAAEPPDEVTPSPPEGAAVPSRRTPSWKALALDGRHQDAFALLREHRKSLRDPEDLLLAADVARLSGHPAEAVPYLERLIKESGSHPRAAMAAFALGRIRMTSLAQPAAAALDFADARRRAQGGSLAEDALAREVEAWSLAGAADRARERAQEYLRFYPQGQRSRAVRTFGKLE